MSKQLIARLENSIGNIASNLEECQATLEQLETDLNRLIDTGVGNTSSKRKIKAKKNTTRNWRLRQIKDEAE